MPKRVFSDVVFPKDKSVRNIKIEHNISKNKKKLVSRHKSLNNRKKISSFGVGAIIVVLVIFLFFSFSILFSDTKILVYPKQDQVNINRTVEIEKGVSSAGIGYEIINLEKTATKKVRATGEEFIEKRASGNITIYNNYDSNSQKLIKNTRFESPDGLIYRIKSSVVVPGKKVVDGEVIPGNIEVTVYADEPGEKYNKEMTDFTIPGFKGDPRFDKFYARSNTKMSGGFIGNIKNISEEEKEKNIDELRRELVTQLENEIKKQIPEGFIFYENFSEFVFEDEDSMWENEDVIITQKAIMHTALFKNKEVASYVAKKEVIGYEGEEVEILDTSKLVISPTEEMKEEGFSVISDDYINVNLNGNIKIVWVYDESTLKNDLMGKNKDDINFVLSKYKSIERAEVIIKPFWKRSLPSDLTDIRIERILGDITNL